MNLTLPDQCDLREVTYTKGPCGKLNQYGSFDLIFKTIEAFSKFDFNQMSKWGASCTSWEQDLRVNVVFYNQEFTPSPFNAVDLTIEFLSKAYGISSKASSDKASTK